MFNETSKSNYLTIAAKKGAFIYNGQEITARQFSATITGITLKHDPGNKKEKIAPGDIATLQMTGDDNGTEERVFFQIPLRGFLGKKFLCALPNVETHFLTFSINLDKETDFCNLFTGFRIDASNETKPIWSKYKFKFDKDGDILNDKKETQDPAEIIKNWCELMELSYTDARTPAAE
jgi:hypothetical protein